MPDARMTYGGVEWTCDTATDRFTTWLARAQGCRLSLTCGASGRMILCVSSDANWLDCASVVLDANVLDTREVDVKDLDDKSPRQS